MADPTNEAAKNIAKNFAKQFKNLKQVYGFLLGSSDKTVDGLRKQKEVTEQWIKRMKNLGQGKEVETLQKALVGIQDELKVAMLREMPVIDRFKVAIAGLLPTFTKGQAAARAFHPAAAQAAKAEGATSSAILKFAAMQTMWGVLIQVIVGLFTGIRDTFTSLASTVGLSNTTLQQSIELYRSSRITSAALGASQKDLLDGLNALESAYAINQATMKRFASTSLAAVGSSVGQFLGMAKMMGMAGKEAGIFGADLVRMGASITNLPTEFARFQIAAEKSQLTTADMAQIIGNLAPASYLTANALDKTYNAFTELRQAAISTTDPLLKSAGSVDRVMRLVNESMMSFSKSAATMTLPETMVFGGAREVGGDPMEALRRGIERGPIVNALEYVSTIMKGSQDASQGIFAGINLLNQRFTLSTEQSYALVPLLEKIREINLSAQFSDEERNNRMRAQLTKAAAVIATTTDPIEQIRGVVEGIFGVILDIRSWLKGGRGLLPRIIKAAV